MRLSIVAKPATKERLEAIRQIGAEDVVYYSIEDRAAIFDQFGAFVERVKAADLRASVVEAGPPIGKIVMGEDGWREQTDDWVDAIRLLASHGVEVICYNFMPQVFDDAMVVRTSFETKRVVEQSPVHTAQSMWIMKLWWTQMCCLFRKMKCAPI